MAGFIYQTSDKMWYGILKEFAKKNRQFPTEAESILWHMIRGKSLGVSFRRQHIIGPFIADFCCLERKLIIEVDGAYHQVPEQQISDKERAEWLNQLGFNIIRFTNEEIICNTDNVLSKIKEHIENE